MRNELLKWAQEEFRRSKQSSNDQLWRQFKDGFCTAMFFLIDKINSIPLPSVEGYLEGKVDDGSMSAINQEFVFMDDALTALRELKEDCDEKKRQPPSDVEGYLEGKDLTKSGQYVEAGEYVFYGDALTALRELKEDCEGEKQVIVESCLQLQAEVERLKDISKELLHLNNCEMEGLRMPTPKQWYDAYNRLSELINPPKQ